MVEIIPPANPLVPLAAPPDRAGQRGHDERPPHWSRHRSFHEEMTRAHAAFSYTSDDEGTRMRAARVDDNGHLMALIVDVERTAKGPRTKVSLVREVTPHPVPTGSLLQPGRLVDIVV